MSATQQETQGPKDDNGFELAFSEISHAQLATKAPGVSDYLVGFQILDKNDDETRAAGVFGFKYEDSWLYCPAFFINGRVRGMEMMYVAKPDLFVPLNDAWVNYMLSHRGRSLGMPDSRTIGELGISGPDFSPIADYPGRRRGFSFGKSSGDNQVDFRLDPNVERMFDRMLDVEGFSIGLAKAACEVVDLRRALKHAPSLTVKLAQWMKADEEIANAVFSLYPAKELFQSVNEALEKKALDLSATGRIYNMPYVGTNSYDANDIIGGIKNMKWSNKPAVVRPVAVTDKQASDEAKPLEFFSTKNAYQFSAGLTDEERERMMKGDLVVRDNRQDTEIARIIGSDASASLFSPGSLSGRYEILTRPASPKPVHYWSRPLTIGAGDTRYVGLVLDEENLHGGLVDRRALSATRELPADWNRLYERASAISSMKPGHMHVLLSDDGQVSVPFKFLSYVNRGDTSSYYAVCPCEDLLPGCSSLLSVSAEPSYGCCNLNNRVRIGDRDICDKAQVTHYNNNNERTFIGSPDHVHEAHRFGHDEDMVGVRNGTQLYSKYELERSRRIVVLDDRHLSKPVQSGDTICVPTGWKALDLGYPNGSTVEGKQFKELELGNAASMDQWLLAVTTPLKVVKSSGDYWIGNNKDRGRFDREDALIHLIRDWGLRKDAAERVLESSSRIGQRWYVKKAAPASDSAPAFPPYHAEYDTTLGVNAQRSRYDELPVESMKSQTDTNRDYNIGNDIEVRRIIDSAKNGKRDVFNIGSLKALVNTSDVSGLVDEFLPDMIKGMDRIGRTLFLFYWHYDAFNERYGRQDVLELEESLRNVFGSVGDLVLFLKQKTIENNPVLRSLDIDAGALVD